MPVTFDLVKHAAKPVQTNIQDAEQLLKACAPSTYKNQFKQLLGSSLGPGNSSFSAEQKFAAAENGLINTVLAAHNRHHALVLRPDDIWLAIVVQFSFFVNKHAEELRGRFVAHEGKEELAIMVGTTSQLFDFAFLAPLFADEMAKFVTDPSVRSWIMPDFTTTTPNDRIVGCGVMMGAMKKYFDYRAYTLCGIPRVTVEGVREDWEEILRRADKLPEYGNEMVLWHELLMPILNHFVATFDDPQLKQAENRNFWEQMVQYKGAGSGVPYFTGWLTAFNSFDQDGNWIHKSIPNKPLLGNVSYPTVTTDKIPLGCVEVDIKLSDNGIKYDAMMLAGLSGMRVTSSGDKNLSPASDGTNDTTAPLAMWWMFLKPTEEDLARKEETRLRTWKECVQKNPRMGKPDKVPQWWGNDGFNF